MKSKICIIGLGYVGLPLAIEFSKKYSVVGFDINLNRIKDLKDGKDVTKEVNNFNPKKIFFTCNEKDIHDSNIYIVTVPTPVNHQNKPDFSLIKSATKTLAKYLMAKNLVIYESTVHPGATDNICIPLIERISKLKCDKNNQNYHNNFYCGYSPERINPGDKTHTLKKIKKLVSGSSFSSLRKVSNLYKSIGIDVFPTDNIMIAEAAKIIENTQRDLNIALINELSIIFDKMKLNTYKILKAAGTKWNFLNFQPGLVGGHCIGVDPYYLTHATKKIGYNPKLILAGREMNDKMSNFICKKFENQVVKKKFRKNGLKILLMGITFKEDCPDIRNSKVYDLYKNLKDRKYKVDVIDPHVSHQDVKKTYNIKIIDKPKVNYYDGIIIAVPHKKFKKLGLRRITLFAKKKRIIFDVKNLFENNVKVDLTL